MNNFSTTGYKDNSPHNNRSHNVIPGNLITMKGVSKQLTLIPIVNGKPQYDRKRLAKPGDQDIQFEDDVEGVLEIPVGQVGMLTPYMFQQIPGMQQPPVLSAINGVQNNPFDYSSMAPASATPNPMVGSTVPLGPVAPPPHIPAPAAPLMTQSQGQLEARARTMEVGIPQTLDPNVAQEMQASIINREVEKKKGQPFVGAINPYGGWNMANTSTALGAFIQNKNVLGTIGSAGKLLLEGTRNALAGAGAMKMYNEGQDEYENKLEEEERNMRWRWNGNMQKGGTTSAQMLTGNFIEGNDEHPNPNTEVERGEYLQTPDGATMEVLGDRHSQGGEMLGVPGGTKVISDYLKIGAKNATFFKKEFDINVKATSTFATVLDKYKKKIGLTELLEDETKLMKKLEDQEEIEFEGTKEINLQVLSEKINEMQPEKQEMEIKFENFTNVVFDRQEASKEPGQNNFKKQEGGEVDGGQPMIDENGQPVPQATEQQGGSDLEQLIMAFSQITGQDPAQIIQQLQQLPEDQLEQAVQQMTQVVQEAMAQQQGVPPQEGMPQEGGMPQEAMMQKGGSVQYAQKGLTVDEFNKLMADYEWDSDYAYGDIAQQAVRLKSVLDRLKIPYNEKDLATQAGQDKLAGQAQQKFRSTYRGTSDHYSRQVAPTQTGLQTALDNNLITVDELKNLGVKVADGKVLRGSKGIIPKENEGKLTELITANGSKNPEAYTKYVDNNFVDNKWYYRFADVKDVQFNNDAERDAYLKDFEKIEDADGKSIYFSKKQGLYFNPLTNKTAPTEEAAKEAPATNNAVSATAGLTPPRNEARDALSGLPLLVPNQDNIAPNLLQPGLRTFGHVQANALNISPENTIRELNRQYTTASNKAAADNPQLYGFLQTGLQAQANSAINQAYSQAEMANAQDERNVSNINEERIQNRDNSNIGALNNFEMLSQRALDNYGQSWRNFIDKKNIENVNNYNLQQQVNASNAINDNYQIGAMGQIYQTDEAPVFYANNGKMYIQDKKTGEYSEVKKVTDAEGKVVTTEKSGTKPVKKKKGGLLLKNSIKNILK